jgi:hypothetical protein
MDVLRARNLPLVYSPEVDFSESRLGIHPSQVSESLVEGKNMLKQGVIRRIGDGRETHLWNHNWSSGRVITKSTGYLLSDRHIVCLFEPKRKTKVDLRAMLVPQRTRRRTGPSFGRRRCPPMLMCLIRAFYIIYSDSYD